MQLEVSLMRFLLTLINMGYKNPLYYEDAGQKTYTIQKLQVKYSEDYSNRLPGFSTFQGIDILC